MLFLLAIPVASAGKVFVWDVGGIILHPRLSPDGLYFSTYGERVWLKTNETHFIYWEQPYLLNGLSVGDSVYMAADWGPALALNPSNDTLYAWEYSGLQLIHVYAKRDTAYFAGMLNGTGGVGILKNGTLTFYRLPNETFKTYDVFPALDRVYFTIEFKDEPKGGVGILFPENRTFYLWRLPENYSTLVPDGITVDGNLTVYAAIMEGETPGVAMFEPYNATFRFLKIIGRPLHVKLFGNYVLLMNSDWDLVLFNPGNVTWTGEAVLEREVGEMEVISLGGPTKTLEVNRGEVEIEPTLERVEKRTYPEGYTAFPGVAFTHDFGGGYVGSGGRLILLDELRPKVHLLYGNGTLKAWVTPREYFPGPVFIYINGKLARWGEEVEWNATFLAGEYNITAVYFDGEDVYMNRTRVVSNLKPRLLWQESLPLENGAVIYGKVDIQGAPVNVSGRTVWTDSEGYFSFFVENESYTPPQTPVEGEGGSDLGLILAVLGAAAVIGGLVLYARKDKRGLALLVIGILLTAGYFALPRPAEEAGGEKPLTVTLTAVMPPSFYAINLTVSVDGKVVGTTDERGRIEVLLTPGLHSFELKAGNSSTTFAMAVAEDRNLTVPFFPGLNATLHNGPGYNGFSASFGKVALNTLHPNTFPRGPMAGRGYATQEECELCKLKAAMVGVVEGESCRLCCIQGRTFLPATIFARYFSLIWDAIERYPCITPWPPMPETNAVITGASINSYADDIEKNLPNPGWGNIHPCLAPLDGLNPKDPSTVCSALECRYGSFNCNCYVTCLRGPFKVWEAFIGCVSKG
ncbi:hypothetical protein [Palaeococcus ferrophilus]|uniref:hypothetical protein n=1 Tax=Palaeococcus ferrophilus TaxID=83868 RepID=UPI001FE1F18C|nr:hypothetical protein [Palaeococcus ferrophilus]